MARVALDSNVLTYAHIEPETHKGRRAADLIARAHRDGVIPVQALGEYLRFVQRRAPRDLERAVRQALLYRAGFATPATTPEVMEAAAGLALAHRLQLWDAVVCVAARQAGAAFLLSEDMQHGRAVEGVRVLDPFSPDHAAEADALLEP